MIDIVEFDNGKFGVRKPWLYFKCFGYGFLNMEIPHIWSSMGCPYFNECMTDYDTAVKKKNLLLGSGYKVVVNTIINRTV